MNVSLYFLPQKSLDILLVGTQRAQAEIVGTRRNYFEVSGTIRN